MKNQSIGVFDSGLGGLSVLKQLIALMPNESYIYYGDSLHAPYGTKSLEQVQELTMQAVEHLSTFRMKGLVIACNTATSAAIRRIRSCYPQLVVVGIEPAIKPAALSYPHSRVLVMATPRTLKEEKFLRLSQQFGQETEIVKVPCEGLMEFVERGILEGEELERYLQEKLAPYLTDTTRAVVLGCTHYPFLWKTLEKVLGGQIPIFDGSFGTARELQRRLAAENRLASPDAEGHLTLMNSKEETMAEFTICPDGSLISKSPIGGLWAFSLKLLQSENWTEGSEKKGVGSR